MRTYCSVKCREEYGRCFLFWQSFRDDFLNKHGKYCDKCGINNVGVEVDHKIAIMNGGDEFDKENLQVLCYQCHKDKTRIDHLNNRLKTQSLEVFAK